MCPLKSVCQECLLVLGLEEVLAIIFHIHSQDSNAWHSSVLLKTHPLYQKSLLHVTKGSLILSISPRVPACIHL